MPSATTVAHTKHDRRLSARVDRYEALRTVWRWTNDQRLAYCRRVVTDKAAGVQLRVTGEGFDARGGISGVQTCGSTWSCPVCSEVIQARRQSEIHAAITTAQAAGYGVLFGTVTLRHKRADRLDRLWDDISPAWNRTTSGAGIAWHGSKAKKTKAGIDREIGDKARFGIQGIIRLVEVKYGKNGWHPHIHFLIFTKSELNKGQIADLQGRLFGRWEAALAARGRSVLAGPGIDLRPVHRGEVLADYFAKSTYRPTTPAAAAFEVTGSSSKRAGKGGRSPFEVLAGIVADSVSMTYDKPTGLLVDETTGETSADLHVWREWEKASKGRRQLTWSHKLRARLHQIALDLDLADQAAILATEKDDQDIVEEAALAGDVVAVIPTTAWKAGRLWFHIPQLLEHAEAGTVVQLLGDLYAADPPD